MKKSLFLLFLPLLAWAQQGFVHSKTADDGYVWPDDPQVLDKLDRWQDLKFGVLFHYGLYSLPGCVESWSVCSEDVDWIRRPHPELPYDQYKTWYFSLADSLAPVNFRPDEWAQIMKDAGMKYVVFTSKHHDGFCTYDSRLTDFTLPRHGGPDMLRGVLDAFREQGLWAGVYFSKPDWHCPDYWDPQFATPTRRENYERQRHPEAWQRYCAHTRGQLSELTNGYGPIDILWLDGGWVSGDEVGLDDVLATARRGNPGMLCVERSIGGRNENYQTPERGIPDHALPHPWESCIPLSDDWGWVPQPNWKSPRQVIALLAETVAKGGSLLLGVGPTADGQIQPEVTQRLEEIGKWLRANGEAIYATRPLPEAEAATTGLWFTQSRDGETAYGIYAPKDGVEVAKTLAFSNLAPESDIDLLDGGKLKYTENGGNVTVKAPKNAKGPFAFKFQPRKPGGEDAELSLDEKIAQLCCVTGWEMYDGTEPSAKFGQMLQTQPVGALWATLRADPWTRRTLANGLNPETAPAVAAKLQQNYPPKLAPLMLAEECPHGLMAIGATVFPTGLCQASTWNPALIADMGAQIASEALAQGATAGYGPVLDVARDPRWSRMEETYGEDPELVAQMGVAYIKGMQDAGLPATMKHFVAYGVPRGGHNGAEAVAGAKELSQEYLEPARRAVKEAHVGSVMTAYNSIDGVPCTANSALLTDTLRGAWGWDGMVVSDLIAINGIAGAGYAKDYAEAAAMALNAGVDMDLGGAVYGRYLKEALQRGLTTEEQIDQALARVRAMKAKAKKPSAAKADYDAGRELAAQIATEGTVLLKNDGLLPLDASKIKKIAVLGPNAHTPYNQLGDYTAPQPDGKVVTPLNGLRDKLGTSRVAYDRVCGIRQTEDPDSVRARVARAARDADVLVVVVGGSSGRDFKTEYADTGAAKSTGTDGDVVPDMECGEGMDRCTLNLLGSQNQLLEAAFATGVPVVAVYVQGRPLDMNLAAEKADALLTQWYPGEQGGTALADLLFGDASPSGRLPVSIPRHVGQLPVHYSQPRRADYTDGPASPLYPFGYGLGYTTFSYGGPVNAGDSITVEVANTGERDGMETVQLYMVDGNRIRLKDFRKVEIPAGASRSVSFPATDGDWLVGPSSDLAHLKPVKVERRAAPACVKNGQFIADGKPYRYVGANAWYLPLLAASRGGDRTRLMAELDTLQALGIDNLRILVGSEGATSHQCQISPNLQTAPGQYDQDLLDGLDFLVAEMERRGMKGVFYLTNSWEWSGGYNTYIDWAGAGKPVLPTIDGYNEYCQHASTFFDHDKAQRLFANHVRAIVPRYKGSPAIFSWQIANEPRAFSARNLPKMEQWLLETARLIKQLDSTHMVSVGSEGSVGCQMDIDSWTRIHASPDIDYATIHAWPTNWGWADRQNLDRDLPQAVAYTYEYVDEHCRAMEPLGKPVVLEEFGWPRDGMAFGRDATTMSRDAYYLAVLDLWQRDPRLAGVNFWGWGGLAVPRHESWQPGDPFTCDPAHEQQGLYSVFASDSPTIELIKRAAAGK